MLRQAWFPIVAIAFGSLFVATPPPALDTRSALYYEDAAIPRPIAAVHARLLAADEGPQLRLSVSALGDGVAPLPGLDGVPGANLRTAEELHRLLCEGQLGCRVRGQGETVAGALESVRREHLPARGIRFDGSIDFDRSTPEAWPVEAVFVVPRLPQGRSWCYLEAGGVPRLTVQIECAGRTGWIVAIESMAEPRAPLGEANQR